MRRPNVYPDEFERWGWQGERLVRFRGVLFFEDRERCKEAAKMVRGCYDIPARAVVIPRSAEYDERYLVMLRLGDRDAWQSANDLLSNCDGVVEY